MSQCRRLDNGKLQRAFGEEVLNILHHVAVTDRPCTEILTTDTTIVDPMLIDLWPLEELPDPESYAKRRAAYRAQADADPS